MPTSASEKIGAVKESHEPQLMTSPDNVERAGNGARVKRFSRFQQLRNDWPDLHEHRFLPRFTSFTLEIFSSSWGRYHPGAGGLRFVEEVGIPRRAETTAARVAIRANLMVACSV